MSVCESCELRAICSIYRMLSDQSKMISYTITECRYRPDPDGNKIDTRTRKAVPTSETSELSKAFDDLIKPEDPPVVPSDDEPKVACTFCGKLVPESMITETLSHERLCPECYYNMPPLSVKDLN